MEPVRQQFFSFSEAYENADISRPWWGSFADPLDLLGSTVEETFDPKESAKTLISIIKTMVTEGEKFIVKFDATQSYCAYDRESEICISVDPFGLDVDQVEQNKIFLGRVVHEAAHLKFTYPEILKMTKCTRNSTNQDLQNNLPFNTQRMATLVNIFEDRRIEELVCKKYPGYFKYLYASRNANLADGYYTSYFGSWVSLNSETGMIQYIIRQVLYPTETLNSEYDQEVLRKAKLQTNFEAIADKLKIRPLNYAGVVGLSKQINELFDERDTEPIYGSSSTGKGTPLKKLSSAENSEQCEEAAKAIKCEIQKILNSASPEKFTGEEVETSMREAKSGEEKTNNVEVGKIKAASYFDPSADERYKNPVLTKPSTKEQDYDKEASKEIERKLRRDFQAYSTVMDRTKNIYEQEEGDIDEDDMYMSKFNKNIFQDEITEQSGGSLLEVVLLIDASGSMYGSSIRLARTISIGMARAFSDNPTVLFSAYAHTANHSSRGFEIVTLKEKRRHLEIKNFQGLTAMSNNADGYAIRWAANQFDKASKSKLLIVLSDGQPAADGYSGKAANEHTHNTTRRVKQAGVKIVSLAVKSYYQLECYDAEDIISYESPSQVTKDLCAWIRKNFSQKMALQTL